ncbi:DUF6157 family protein [Dyadobacter sp. CY312]|uniref:DUF6157 family protein n=1 Tax=Dyadobacter sp. CY312 TaxID=2907303 RepID=UPI001F47CD89|nr:DUF6157 family protein [Dyadobacter sp. CY312]MCE7040935.1 DUF6157 family protein [Dyadobacter sp. CY312]
MKTHTTNYENTFIEVANDSPVTEGQVPPVKGDSKTVANMQFEMISKNPYKYTSDDVLFQVFAERKDLTERELDEARKDFFSKGQACMRASPLTKRYGWGVHNNEEGKIAIYPVGSDSYEKYRLDKNLKTVKAMKSSRQ